MQAAVGGPDDPIQGRPPRWVLDGLVCLLVLIPIGISINFIARFGVDVPYWDQWELVSVLKQASNGTLTLGDLFQQHNEHRILFPRLIMVGLASVTRWDVRAEMWAGWSMLVAEFVILAVELRRNVPSRDQALWAAVPAAWLVFSLRQSENLLWGWQLQIELAALTAVLALWLVADASPTRLAGAICAAGVCSFSFASGLAIWPAGALVLALGGAPRSRRSRQLVLWSGAACLLTVLYLRDFVRPAYHPDPKLALLHPLDALGFLGAVVVGSLVPTMNRVVLWAGPVVVVLSVAWLWWTARFTRATPGTRFGIGLFCFAVGVSLMVTAGRLGMEPGRGWLGPATASRYTTFTLLGCYGLFRTTVDAGTGRRRLLLYAMVFAIALGSVNALRTEFRAGAREARRRLAMRAALLTFATSSDPELSLLYPDPRLVRERATVLRDLGLGPFRPAAR